MLHDVDERLARTVLQDDVDVVVVLEAVVEAHHVHLHQLPVQFDLARDLQKKNPKKNQTSQFR